MFPTPRLMLDFDGKVNNGTALSMQQCIEFTKQLPVKFIPYIYLKAEKVEDAEDK